MATEASKVWCRQNSEKAIRLYFESLTADVSAVDWAAAIAASNQLVDAALLASDQLRDIGAGLSQSAAHMRVFRHALAPPKSQDQFKILCKEWPKTSEKRGVGLKKAIASSCAEIISAWLDKRACPWLSENREPTAQELWAFKSALSALIASQEVSTATRNRLAATQESQVVTLLLEAAWTRLPSKLIDKRGEVPVQHFMHKTRFATGTSTPQEVDIACGLPNALVLAMECKVTNDGTNSVKRINDVLKKANAWRAHYGNFIQTAAMLQGVIKPKDVERLIDADVKVFWSHDISDFGSWLNERLSTGANP